MAIIGSRDCGDMTNEDIIPYIPQNCAEIVSGGARGIDTLAQQAAKKLGIKFRCFLPNYNLFGRLAPLKRNISIVDYSDYVLAFWDMKSSGTRYVLAYCLKCEKPFKIIRIKGSAKSKRYAHPNSKG